MASKNRTTPPAAGGEELDAATLDRVVALLLTGTSREGVAAACRAELGLAGAGVDAAIDAGRAKLILAAGANWTLERGRAIARCQDLYRLGLEAGESGSALAAQKELNKLLSLYAAGGPEAGEPGAGEASDASDADAGGAGGPGGPRRPGDQAAAEIVAAVDLHLEPLALVDDAAEGDAPATYADLIAAAAAEILLARSARARAARSAKKPTTKPAMARRSPLAKPAAPKASKQAKKPTKRRRA